MQSQRKRKCARCGVQSFKVHAFPASPYLQRLWVDSLGLSKEASVRSLNAIQYRLKMREDIRWCEKHFDNAGIPIKIRRVFTVPAAKEMQKTTTGMIPAIPFSGASDVKEEIKTECDDNYSQEKPSTSSFIYDPAEVKEEIDDYDEYGQPTDDKDGILDTPLSLQDLTPPAIIEDIKKEEPDFDQYPSTSQQHSVVSCSRSDTITRVVKKSIHCASCGELFKFKFQLANHQKKKCIEPASIRVNDVTKDQTWRGHTKLDGCYYIERYSERIKGVGGGETINILECGVCGERFANARDHRSHAIRSHPNDKEERLCKNEYCVKMRIVHNPKQIPPMEDEFMSAKLRSLLTPMYDPLACPICKVKLDSYFHLYFHYTKDHAMDYFLRLFCQGCGKIFTSPKGLRKHIIDNSEIGDGQCGGAGIQPPTRRKKRLADQVSWRLTPDEK